MVGFQHLGDAKRFLSDLRKRFAKFSLELHPDKTRLIEFGRFAAKNRRTRSRETGDVRFPGLHPCLREDEGRALLAPAHHHQKEDEGEVEAGESRASAAPSLAHPRAGALAGERVEGTPQLLRRARQHRFGHGLPRPDPVALIQTLRRRSQRHRMTWERYSRIEKKWLPLPASCTPTPACASPPEPKAGARCANSARRDLSGGPPARAVPTGIHGIQDQIDFCPVTALLPIALSKSVSQS